MDDRNDGDSVNLRPVAVRLPRLGDARCRPVDGEAAFAETGAKALPGMYGLDSLGASVHGTTVSIGAATDCAFVAAPSTTVTIRAGFSCGS